VHVAERPDDPRPEPGAGVGLPGGRLDPRTGGEVDAGELERAEPAGEPHHPDEEEDADEDGEEARAGRQEGADHHLAEDHDGQQRQQEAEIPGHLPPQAPVRRVVLRVHDASLPILVDGRPDPAA
jgi:hypothetical protein